MGRRRWADGATPAAAVLGAGALTVALDGGVGELVFLTALLLALLVALRHAWRASRGAVAEARRQRAVAALAPEQAAASAVAAEGARLSADLRAVVRAALQRIARLAGEAEAAWPAGPPAQLADIQREGRAATSELRRMLGLLRQDQPAPAPPPPEEPAPAAAPGRLDVVLAVAAVTEAVITASVSSPGFRTTPLTVLLTAAAAATVLGRRPVPATAAVVLAALTVLGTLLGHPVTEGLWMVLTVGGLAWGCAALERRWWWGAVGLAAVAASLVHKHAAVRPENLGIALVILAAGAVLGAVVRLARRRAATARRAASAREAELAAARAEAVAAARLALARELHDLCSGAIGVVVMQAGAAEVLYASDRAAAHRSLGVVARTCRDTLEELDRLLPGLDGAPGSVTHGLDDVRTLVDRMRAAGLDVTLHVRGDPGPSTTTAYRILQEALMNSLRHSPGSRVRAEIVAADGRVRVTVRDDGPGPAEAARRGYGLVGLAERVELGGGTLTAGPGPDGVGFRVEADLPARAVTGA